MLVKIIKNIHPYFKDEIVKLDDKIAKRVIDSKYAEEFVEEKKPVKKRGE